MQSGERERERERDSLIGYSRRNTCRRTCTLQRFQGFPTSFYRTLRWTSPRSHHRDLNLEMYFFFSFFLGSRRIFFFDENISIRLWCKFHFDLGKIPIGAAGGRPLRTPSTEKKTEKKPKKLFKKCRRSSFLEFVSTFFQFPHRRHVDKNVTKMEAKNIRNVSGVCVFFLSCFLFFRSFLLSFRLP